MGYNATFGAPIGLGFPTLCAGRRRRGHLGGRQTLGHNLLTNLAAFYPLNEKAAMRFDPWRARNVADNNTVTSAADGWGNLAAEFVSANSEYLDRVDSALYGGNTDFTFAAWLYLANKSASYSALSSASSDTNREYFLQYVVGSDRFRYLLYTGGTIVGNVSANNFGSPTAATWYFVVGRHNVSGNSIDLSVNAGTADSATRTGTPTITSNATFSIGRSSPSATQYWNGRIKHVGFWRRLLTNNEVTFLYNNGRGRPFPFVTAA